MKTKIGTEVAHVTRDSDTTFKVKTSKVNLQGAGAYCGGLQHSLFLALQLSWKCLDLGFGWRLFIILCTLVIVTCILFIFCATL